MSLYSLSEIDEERVKDKLYRKLIVGKRVMLAQIILKKGCSVVSHRHESEQMTFVFEGLLEFTLPNGKVRVGKGQVLVIPSNLEHSAVAFEDTLEFDIFSPIREDWLTGKDYYLRKG
ncbi:MAG: cupin domain-containing protein [Candidatus Bathyarchaeota archaeon]|nr:cupin domain-containing protein [Candidatus Bathyarchaeota archaeon]